MKAVSGFIGVALVLVVAGCASAQHAVTQGSTLTVHAQSAQKTAAPKNFLIVPGVSIGGIRYLEPRRSVTKELGPGKRTMRWVDSYFSGRLQVVYAFHDRYTGVVQALVTKWPAFHTRSGVHVGSSREDLRSLHVTCGEGSCSWATSRLPDASGIIFTMHDGKVVEIFVGSD